MDERRNQDVAPMQDANSELALLREENQRLRQVNEKAFGYIREKVDGLLTVIGTRSLNPQELDDNSLIEFDPIEIVSDAFQHVLKNVQETNRKLSFAHDEISTVFDTVGAAILVVNPSGEVVSYNRRTQDLLLGSDNEMYGKTCRNEICEGRSADNRCVFEAVVREGREQHIEDWTLNGKTFDVVGRPMFKESGQLSHVVMSYSDVSARRNAEAALLEALHETQSANAKLHGILRSVADGVLVSDQDGKILLMNRRAEELFGLKLSDSQSPLFVSQLSNQKLTGLLVGAIAQGEEQQIHDVVFDQAGEREQVYQARITAIDAQQADFKGCITIFHDVTEERKIDHMKSEFVSTAAHELRTPLATIIGYTDLLLLKEDTDLSEQKEYLELIQDRAERLGDIVSDLLDISRIESGEALNVELKPCQIKLFCQEVVDSYRRQLPKHSFTLSVGAQDMVIADRFAVIQILENVISNAIKYSPDGGVISLVGVKDENMYHLAIADQGMGMNEAQVARIFEKFYRADATNTAISGTGLGMTIVKYLIESLNGKIQLESVADKGTTVTLSFPLFSA